MSQPTNAPEYFFWKNIYKDGFCICENIQGFDDSHKLNRGVSVAADFPDTAFFPMDPDFPKDIKLGDGIRNRSGVVLISDALKKTVEGMALNNVEFLQVQIKNHKGRIASKEYFILNPLDVCDAIDLNQSDVKWNQINPSIIATCKKLVLDPEKIPPAFKVFRLKSFPRHAVVRGDVADAVRAGNFTCVAFTNVKEFSGF